MAGVALGDIELALVARSGRSGRGGRRRRLRGRGGTWWHPSSLSVAGMALADIVCPGCHRGASSRVKLRCTAPASAVAWMLRGNVCEAHFVVLRAVARMEGVKNFMLRIYQSEAKSPQTLTYDKAWTSNGDSAGGHVDDWRCRVRSSRAIDAPCENVSSLLPALRRTRLDCRAVRRFLVAATGSAVYATRLPRMENYRLEWKSLILLHLLTRYQFCG